MGDALFLAIRTERLEKLYDYCLLNKVAMLMWRENLWYLMHMLLLLVNVNSLHYFASITMECCGEQRHQIVMIQFGTSKTACSQQRYIFNCLFLLTNNLLSVPILFSLKYFFVKMSLSSSSVKK